VPKLDKKVIRLFEMLLKLNNLSLCLQKKKMDLFFEGNVIEDDTNNNVTCYMDQSERWWFVVCLFVFFRNVFIQVVKSKRVKFNEIRNNVTLTFGMVIVK